jgi:predicted membrane GTPase involved in stress response
MLDQPDAVAVWHDVLGGMFTDRRFRQFKKFCWYGEINGARVGIAVANKSAQYTNYALNKVHVEGLLAAKHGGKVDRAFIVAVANGAFIIHHDAEEYHADLLVNLTPRSGRFGEFWTLTEYDVTGEEAPF